VRSLPHVAHGTRNASSTVKISVTGAGGLLGQGLAQSLLSSALDVTVVALDPDPLGVGLYWAPERSLIPYGSRADLPAALKAAIRDKRPDAVLIGSDVELPAVAAHPGRGPKRNSVCRSSYRRPLSSREPMI
jgi:hypothetical protein